MFLPLKFDFVIIFLLPAAADNNDDEQDQKDRGNTDNDAQGPVCDLAVGKAFWAHAGTLMDLFFVAHPSDVAPALGEFAIIYEAAKIFLVYKNNGMN